MSKLATAQSSFAAGDRGRSLREVTYALRKSIKHMNQALEVRLLRTAEDDITGIVSYVHNDRPAAAEKLLRRFEQKMELLAENP